MDDLRRYQTKDESKSRALDDQSRSPDRNRRMPIFMKKEPNAQEIQFRPQTFLFSSYLSLIIFLVTQEEASDLRIEYKHKGIAPI